MLANSRTRAGSVTDAAPGAAAGAGNDVDAGAAIAQMTFKPPSRPWYVTAARAVGAGLRAQHGAAQMFVGVDVAGHFIS
jgi:hypothetical protein